MLDGIRKRGFKLTFGEKESGVLPLWLDRGGGYYFGKSKKSITSSAMNLIDTHLSFQMWEQVKPSQMARSN